MDTGKGLHRTKRMMSGFDKWYFTGEKCDVREFKDKGTNQYYKIKEAWDHQQNKINVLETKLAHLESEYDVQDTINEEILSNNKKLTKAVEFYADKYNWDANSYRDGKPSMFDAFINDDEERIGTRHYGGKLARQTLKEIK